MTDINLYDLKINIPFEFDSQGLVMAYQLRSIGDILDDKEWYELYTLQDWVTTQFLKYLDWDIRKEITTDNIARVIQTFEMLGIAPTNITLIKPHKFLTDTSIVSIPTLSMKSNNPNGNNAVDTIWSI